MITGFLLKNSIILLKKIFNKVGIGLNFSADGEDSIIIKWLGGIKNGFYIDIGSYKPLFGSNTFNFYIKGWSGICIDPNPGLKLKYFLLRPNDLFINSAVVLKKKNKKNFFYYYKNHSDLNTFSKKRMKIQKKLFKRFPTKTLNVDQLSSQNLAQLISDKEVHFLNIDIEGMEDNIIRFLIENKIFPWCIAIEELGNTCENINTSRIKKFLNKNGYFLGSRTFFTSIYIRKNILKKLPSKYVKEVTNIK